MKKSSLTLLCLAATALIYAQKPDTVFKASKQEAPAGRTWLTLGNTGLDPSKYFIGTRDNKGFSIRTANMERMRITFNGSVGIGTSTPGGLLEVAGGDALINRLTIGRGGDPFDSSNTAIGYKALMSNIRYSPDFTNSNTAVGAFALKDNTIGLWNTAVGFSAMEATTEGFENTALGYRALNENTTGGNNTAVGVDAMRLSKGGHENTAVGQYALTGNAVGNWNTATGFNALSSNGNGSWNTALGSYSMEDCTGCNFNTAVGTFSVIGGNSTANTAVGYSAGQGISISNSTFLGYFALGNFGISNSTAIGNEAFVPASNQVVIGNANVTSIGGFANWTNISDGRYKKNVKEDVPGLAFINQLRPVTYTLDVDGIEKARETGSSATSVSPANRRPHNLEKKDQQNSTTRATFQRPSATLEHINGKQKKAGVIYTGFVAQEVESAAKVLNYDFSGVDKPKDKSGFYGLRYSDFVVPLVQAVKELSEKANEVDRLKTEMDAMSKRIERLEEMLRMKTDVKSSKGFLKQNTPNPFNSTTSISYYVPAPSSSAYLLITDMKGQTLKKITISNRGTGQATLYSAMLASGTYNYSLWIDGKQVETKQLVLSR